MSVVLPAGWVPGSGWVSPTNCRACRWSFLLGGFQVRGGSAPRTAAHVGGPSCWVGSRFGVGQPHELPRMSVVLPAGWVPGSGWVSPTNCRACRCSFLPVSVTRYLSRLYTTDLRLARLERQSVGNVT